MKRLITYKIRDIPTHRPDGILDIPRIEKPHK